MRMATSAVTLAVWLACAVTAAAQEGGALRGTVLDPLGARVSGAAVVLLRDGRQVAETASGARGEYVFERVAPARYRIRVRAEGFEPHISDEFFSGASGRAVVDVTLAIGPLQQEVVVTASAGEVPVSQIGSQVTVLDAQVLDRLAKPDILEALRLVPGAHVVQNGQRGGVTSFFVRGGASNFNKVLVDGVPANDIGGAFDLSSVSTTGVERVEVLREANSVLYGADSLAGVLSLTTQRGRTRVPQLMYSIDGGTLDTVRSAVSIGGAIDRFDYFSELGYFQTDNDLPNNRFRNATYAGRFSAAAGAGTDVSATIRRTDTRYGNPNAFDYFLLADDARQDGDFTYVGVTAQSLVTSRLRTTVRYAGMRQTTGYENPTPTGEPFDPFGFGANYLGRPVTITGGHGHSVSGRAILDFGGAYPTRFASRTSRDLIFGQAVYEVTGGLAVSGGGRVEREDGFTRSGAGAPAESERNNAGAFVEGRASIRRLHVTGGVGIEHNGVFENAVSPRLSVAAYLRDPSSTSRMGETKLTFNAGRGVKAPAIFQELSSLHALVPSARAAALGVEPIGPERARTLDAGVEQGVWRGQLRLRTTFFHNEFSDLIEYVSRSVLPRVGVAPEVAAATSFGAYVNSQSYRARGVEVSADALIARLRAAASYTFLDAVVTESFAGGALAPAINPAFPGIPIGAFSPLVGGRPFRRPTHAGSLLLSYAHGPAQVTLAGYFSGRQDDSTFLSDGFFGNSLLLPNEGLDAAYQKVDVSGSYRIHRRLRWYASVENLGGEQYYAVAGYRALPRTFRSGLSVTLGGDASMP